MGRLGPILVACLLAGCGGESDTAKVTASGSGAGGAGGGGGSVPGAAELPCAPGELPTTDGSCLAPGVPEDACGKGFAPDGAGSCTPILPATACGPGQLALLGEKACHGVAPCGAGTWGDIPNDATTQFVDASYVGGASDGTQSSPWTTVADGIAAATAGATVAIAAGTYAENVVLDKKLVLWGICPEKVQLGAAGTAAIQIQATAGGSEIRDLALTSAAFGVDTLGATGVLVDRVWIHDTASFALFTTGADGVQVTRTLMEGAHDAGMVTVGSTLTLEDSVVRGTQASSNGAFGRGMSFEPDQGTGQRSTGVVRRTIVASNLDLGILALGSDVTVEDSLVTDTVSRLSDKLEGSAIAAGQLGSQRAKLAVTGSVIQLAQYCGICAYDSQIDVDTTTIHDIHEQESDKYAGFGYRVMATATSTERPVGTIRRSTIARTHQVGLIVRGADATIESVIVSDTMPSVADDRLGRGISVELGDAADGASNMLLRGSRIEKSREVGVLLLGSQGVIESTLVRETLSSAKDGRYGFGIGYLADSLDTDAPSSGKISSSVVEGARMAGIVVAGADVSIEDVYTKDTLPQGDSKDFGDGIIASSYLFKPKPYPTKLDILRVTVSGSARAGIASFGAPITLDTSKLDCNLISLDGEDINGVEFVFEDRGHNACACKGEGGECTVLSSGLEPPLGALP